ncbi:MAG TPA: GspE/PulE family protein, partial [Gemmatimonadaceae bacterium]|nr:GspE/PulE family protein [Gemmatimonadaceae bacterium]
PVRADVARDAIRRVYGESSAQSLIDAMGGSEPGGVADAPAIDDLRALANEAPVIRLVNMLLSEALAARASDVHLEAYADALRVRYRIDGVLQDAPSPPKHMAPAIVSRLKVMADLDIAERRAPQDGRIRLTLQDRQVDVRVSTIPTLHGESVVLRLLDKEQSSGRLALDSIGLSDDDLARLERVLTIPHGILLATGPTGSGKTTTLYAALERLRTGREKILTVEDPVEYQLAGIPQVPVNEKAGVTFASALRALLRQDPDVMLVGEIRDGETAEIATQAALTGHLVLSTLHTNDAIGALTRLVDLGVAPFLVAATVEAVLAQRLVRTVCDSCGRDDAATDAERGAIGMPALATVRRGRGCDACRGSGYSGRTGVYELLVLDDAMREAISAKDGVARVRVLARERGMRTLRDDGARLVASGITTPEEVLRVCRS